MREEVPFDAAPLFTFQKDDDFCKYGFVVVFRIRHCEKRIVQVLVTKERHNYDFLLLHKEHEVLRNNHS